MKIVLYKPLIRPEHHLDPVNAHYIGFNYLISYVNNFEHDCTIKIAYTPEAIIDMQPDLIGISSVSEMWERTKNTISWLRNEGFSGPIVIGGPHITALPETLPQEADCAVIGQGEATFLELIRSYKISRQPNLNEIMGISYRDSDNQVCLNARRTPIELDSLPIDVYENPSIPFQLTTVRGCPFHCFHCVEHFIQGKMTYLSADKLLWLMKSRFRTTGNPHFYFQDDTFLAPRRRLEELHDLMAKTNMLGKFTIQSISLNANLVDEKTMPMLKDIGTIKLGIGIESLNPRMLETIKCGIVKPEHIDRTIQYAQKTGIPIGGSQVYGFPGETRGELIDSIMRIKHYEMTTAFRHWVCYICQPLPGSQLWFQELEKGNVSTDMDFSTLRIDGDCRFFDTPWHYGNEENIPRNEFISILKDHEMIAPNFLLLPENTVRKQQKDSGLLKRIAYRLYRDILLSIEGRRQRKD
ncbi:MAG: radical SAM protein [Proteobacteria bacterium]|nr:radical SAM protein [Pseudomonadota bacterium]